MAMATDNTRVRGLSQPLREEQSIIPAAMVKFPDGLKVKHAFHHPTLGYIERIVEYFNYEQIRSLIDPNYIFNDNRYTKDGWVWINSPIGAPIEIFENLSQFVTFNLKQYFPERKTPGRPWDCCTFYDPDREEWDRLKELRIREPLGMWHYMAETKEPLEILAETNSI